MMGRTNLLKRCNYFSKWISLPLALVFVMVLSFTKPVRAQDLTPYAQLASFISLVALVGGSNITNTGKKHAFANLTDLAFENTNAASDGFESGNTSQEISKNSAAHGNLEAAGYLLDPNDVESSQLIAEIQVELDLLKQSAIERLSAGAESCGNGTLDPGEDCDNSSGQKSCPDGSFCLENCQCDELR